MIAKLIKGKGFRGALAYDLNEAKGAMLTSNMAGSTPRELAAEFGVIRQLRPRLKNAVAHVSIAIEPEKQLSDDDWKTVVDEYMDGMGYTDNQYVATQHFDTEHPHIHIIINRIKMDGTVVSDSNDYKRQEPIMRKLEQKFGLAVVQNSNDVQLKAPTKTEIEMVGQTGKPSIKMMLQDFCTAALKNVQGFTDYVQRLESVGVDVIPTLQVDDTKLSGIQYRLDGVTMKGSDLGKALAAAGIQKSGAVYVKDRDGAAIARCREREAARWTSEEAGELERTEVSISGRAGPSAGAAGSGHGSTGGRDKPDAGENRPQERVSQEPIQRASAGGIAVAKSDPAGSGSQRSSDPSRSSEIQQKNLDDGYQRGSSDGPSDRIGALSGAPLKSNDRTVQAVRRHLDALGVDALEIGIKNFATGQMMNRQWTRAELEQSIAWLKRLNAKGENIYVRPSSGSGVVLVDDLKADAIKRMVADGFAPAAVIETSPGNYQAWVKLSVGPLSDLVRLRAAEGLAKKYGGDAGSVDANHYGRLAGFTNRKPANMRNGRAPFVLAHDCPGDVAKGASEALKRIDAWLVRGEVKREQQRRLEAIKLAKMDAGNDSDPCDYYRNIAAPIAAKYANNLNLSQLDWMTVKSMIYSNRFTYEQICFAVDSCSPDIENRKAGHIDDYVSRTVKKAFFAVQEEKEKVARGLLEIKSNNKKLDLK